MCSCIMLDTQSTVQNVISSCWATEQWQVFKAKPIPQEHLLDLNLLTHLPDTVKGKILDLLPETAAKYVAELCIKKDAPHAGDLRPPAVTIKCSIVCPNQHTSL